MHADFTGLEEYFTYTFRVAGVTSKGIGAWSTDIYVRTNQDGKIINEILILMTFNIIRLFVQIL